MEFLLNHFLETPILEVQGKISTINHLHFASVALAHNR